MSPPSERRKYQRYDVPCRLRVELPGGRDIRTRTLNISDGGAYFVTDETFDVGGAVTVRLSVPRDTANTFFLEQFPAKAQVIRYEPPAPGKPGAGVALRFENVLALDLP